MISVCMATYNGELYIKEQLDSILYQLSPNDEIIISDDGSSDNTLKIIENFNDSRIKVFPGPQEGIVRNFENALEHSKGKVIFLSDQDDVWLDGKFANTLIFFEFYDLVVCDCKITDSLLKITHESFFKYRGSGTGFFRNFYRNSYLGSCMAFKRDMLQYLLPFPKNLPMHDWWIGLISEHFGRCKFINTPLILFRRHQVNASDSSRKSTSSFYLKIVWRFNLIISIAFRIMRIKIRNFLI